MNNQDYAIGEWWTDHRRIEGDELALYEARAAHREPPPAERPADPEPETEAPPAGVGKTCDICGDAFRTTAPNQVKRCPACRTGSERTATCERCGSTFTHIVLGGKQLQRFCSKSCGAKASRAAQPIPASRYGTCPGCGITYLRKRPDQKYCSVPCRAREARERRKERTA